MTIRFIHQWNGYSPDQIVSSLGITEEARLISLGYATADLDGPLADGGVMHWDVRRMAPIDPLTGRALKADVNFLPRVQSVHDVGLAEPLFELALPSPYGADTATAGGKYEFAYGTPVYCARGFNGYKFWMVGAPYPTQGVGILAGTSVPPLANKYENPCIFVSNDGENWEVPVGLTNPIATSIGNADTNSYYADPYITFNEDYSKLYVIFMHTNQSGTNKTSLMVAESSDGITWSTPVAIYHSTSTTFTPNSPSMFWNGDGWTVICVDTRDGTGTFTIQKMTTSAATPYSGWSAFSTSTMVHPLSRSWWHTHVIPVSGGGIIGMAVDNNSNGGSVYSIQSGDGGATFSVKQFSAHRSGSPGGSWYRPSLCLCSDGVNQSLIGYFSRIGPMQQAGFYIQKARLAAGETDRRISDAILEDMINRQVTVPANLLTGILGAYDSFNRADNATVPGTSDSGMVWTNSVGTFGIGTNRLYNSTAAGGGAYVTGDPGLQNFEYTVAIETLGAGETWLVFNWQNANNRWRFGWTGSQLKFQKIVSGAAEFDKTLAITVASGDRLSVRRQGKYVTVFHNGRPIDTYADAQFSQYTTLGFQFYGATSYIDQIRVKPL